MQWDAGPRLPKLSLSSLSLPRPSRSLSSTLIRFDPVPSEKSPSRAVGGMSARARWCTSGTSRRKKRSKCGTVAEQVTGGGVHQGSFRQVSSPCGQGRSAVQSALKVARAWQTRVETHGQYSIIPPRPLSIPKRLDTIPGSSPCPGNTRGRHALAT